MYGTFDVDAYCWHVLRLWPKLELDNMRFVAGTIDWEDPAYKVYQYAVVQPGDVPADKLDYYWSANKVRGMVPHDIGSPRERPWVILNAFDLAERERLERPQSQVPPAGAPGPPGDRRQRPRIPEDDVQGFRRRHGHAREEVSATRRATSP